MKSAIAAVGCVSLLVLGPVWSLVPAAGEPSVGQVTAVAGQGVVFHASAAQGLALNVQDDVFLRDRIETRERSVVRVLLGGKATVTVRELSTLTITEDPRAATVELSEGKVALHVNKALMKPGDIIRIQTPNAIVGVRGSLVVAEVTGPPDARQSHVTALEASLPILVAPRSDPNQTTALRPNQAVTVSGPRHAARVGTVRMISTERARREAETAEMPGHRREAAQPRWAETRAEHAREAKTDRRYPFRRPHSVDPAPR
jgi:hypothetical protein